MTKLDITDRNKKSSSKLNIGKFVKEESPREPKQFGMMREKEPIQKEQNLCGHTKGKHFMTLLW